MSKKAMSTIDEADALQMQSAVIAARLDQLESKICCPDSPGNGPANEISIPAAYFITGNSPDTDNYNDFMIIPRRIILKPHVVINNKKYGTEEGWHFSFVILHLFNLEYSCRNGGSAVNVSGKQYAAKAINRLG